jgi:hypothetical protein
MQKEIREGAEVHEETRKMFIEMKANDTLVKPDDSALKLVNILTAGTFVSGSHIDYYDA